MIVDFKVNSERIIQFRKWVNQIAKLHAETEFEKYRIIQDKIFMSDYDKFMLELAEQVKSISESK